MKKLTILSLVTSAALAMGACSPTSQENQQEQTIAVEQEKTPETTVVPQDTIKKSIPAEAVGTIGGANIKVAYHAPAVRNRVIWGGLVPYDQVWVTGAHKATTVEFTKAVIIDGKTVPAGKYAFFTIPGREDWTVILNIDWQQHLTDDYDQSKDVMRVKVMPERKDQPQERLKYEVVSNSGSEGAITVYWDKVRVALPVKATS